jgi:hypothetical protein
MGSYPALQHFSRNAELQQPTNRRSPLMLSLSKHPALGAFLGRLRTSGHHKRNPKQQMGASIAAGPHSTSARACLVAFGFGRSALTRHC